MPDFATSRVLRLSLYGALIVSAGLLFTAQLGHAEDVAMAKVRFEHVGHKAFGVDVTNCASCHSLTGAKVEAATQETPHRPCSDSACHASEFMSKEPTICIVCHDSHEPWRKQVVRLRPQVSHDFAAQLSHSTHKSSDCATCHGDVFADGPKPDSHAVCGSCHLEAARPRMTDCGSCHRMGTGKPPAPESTKYRVSASFQHAIHARDPRVQGRQNPKCSVCHEDVTKASTMAAVGYPTMSSCSACHDGKHAFKTTGFDCARCHASSALQPTTRR